MTWLPTVKPRALALALKIVVGAGLLLVGASIGYALRPDSGAHVLARDGDEWSALTTGVAAMVALWFGLREDRSRSGELVPFVNERDEARRLRDADREAAALEQRRRQAYEVVVWATRHAVHNGERWVPELNVGFTNASPWPVSTAHLVLQYPTGTKEIGAVAMVVEAGASSPTFTFHADKMDDLPSAEGVELQFADGSGVHWSKSAKGVLVEVMDHPTLQGRALPGHTFRFIGRETSEPF